MIRLHVLVAYEARMEAKSQGQTSHYKKWWFQTGNEIKFETASEVHFCFMMRQV